MRKGKWFGLAAALLGAVVLMIGCAKPDVNEGQHALTYWLQSGSDYNQSLYYRNDLETACADPSILWVSEEQDPVNGGYFYLYPSSDIDFAYRGVSVYRSRDMAHWQFMGAAFYPKTGSFWAVLGMMAPEVIYDEDDGKYYMWFSGAEERDNKMYFNSHADRAAYKAAETEVETMTELSAVDSALNAYRNLAGDGSYTEAQKNTVAQKLGRYDQMVAAIDADTSMTEEMKAASKLAEAKSALLDCKTVKIEKEMFPNTGYSLGVAISDSPLGPFVQYTNDSADAGYDNSKRELKLADPFITHEDYAEGGAELNDELMVGIDVSPFEDPKDGTKYIYFSNMYLRQQYIYVLKIGQHWTDDPDWTSLKPVTRQGYVSMTGTDRTDFPGQALEEGPHAYYDAVSGKYYLLYTYSGAWDKTYSVAQAVADTAMGPFTKIKTADGGVVTSVSEYRDDMSGPGHCCLVSYDGRLFIAYQGIYNRLAVTGGLYSSQRGICVDEVKFITNGAGQRVMYCNGPSTAVMPKIGPDMQYKNIAGEATVSATNARSGANKATLTDGLMTYTLAHELVKEYDANSGTTTVTLTYDDYRTVRAIMVYNSKNLETSFGAVSRIELDFRKPKADSVLEATAFMQNLKFDTDKFTTHWEGGVEQIARPGGSVAVEFDELAVKEIRITIQSDKPISISEIVVLGK